MDTPNLQTEYHFMTVPKSQSKENIIEVEKPRLVVPIIFIPGVMGSNLKEKTTARNNSQYSKPVWRLDCEISAMGWSFPHYGTAKARKLELDPNATEVDDRGTVVDAAVKKLAQIEETYKQSIKSIDEDDIKKFTEAAKDYDAKRQEIINNHPENKLFGTRRERGWGTVANISYGEFLQTFQESLFDPSSSLSIDLAGLVSAPSFKVDEKSKVKLELIDEQIKRCKAFYFPVHAMGYNWLQSNEDSAMALKKLVEVTLPNYYKNRGLSCEQVILVTHSMGGLVARYYTQALGGGKKVCGVINGVQPSTGAVAAYTRMKRGTEVNGATGVGKISAAVMENVLGKDAAEMTAVCAQSPGPLQLLPTPEYGMRWLTITDPDGNEKSYPESDPYKEIYLAKNKWWCVCEPHLINPLNTEHNQRQMEDDWAKYVIIIKDKVQTFNEDIINSYHLKTYVFFGIEDNEQNINTAVLTYQTAHWQGQFKQGYEDDLTKPIQTDIGDKRRLNFRELSAHRTLEASHHDWVEKNKLDDFAHDWQGVFKWGNIAESYILKGADGNGDGTVPKRSGEIDIKHLKARMHLAIDHEGAYKSTISQEFTLRAIVDIMQEVKIND
ncbi:hypothetical protein RHO14_03105 [Orbus wheelerorum]|uniref:esterase/lipase family protein n=1 Tax=Orbus wheelerorum TaxID=3074111 RepID=UPI00370D769B